MGCVNNPPVVRFRLGFMHSGVLGFACNGTLGLGGVRGDPQLLTPPANNMVGGAGFFRNGVLNMVGLSNEPPPRLSCTLLRKRGVEWGLGFGVLAPPAVRATGGANHL